MSLRWVFLLLCLIGNCWILLPLVLGPLLRGPAAGFEAQRVALVCLAGLVGLLLGAPLWWTRRVSPWRRRALHWSRWALAFNLVLCGGLLYARWHRYLPDSGPSPGGRKPAPLAERTVAPARTPASPQTPGPPAEPVLPAPEATATSLPPAPQPAPAPSTYAAIDKHALAAPASVEGDVPTLTAYLIGPARDEREKIRAIYRWVTDRIAYDGKGFLSGNLPDGAVEVTLRRRMAICDGYSRLVQAMGEAAGLKMEIVGGYARGFRADPEAGENHAWNAVRLPEGWALLDSTWGAGSIDTQGAFHKSFNEFYFLIAPERMISSHFPTEERWQLLSKPLQRQAFLRQPALHKGFYTLGLGLAGEVEEPLRVYPSASLELRAPENVQVLAELRQEGSQVDPPATLVRRDGETALVQIRAPRAGNFTLEIFAGPQGEEKAESVLSLRVDARGGDSRGYPTFFSPMRREGMRLVAPTAGVLEAGAQTFDLVVPEALGVYVNDWKQPLTRTDGHFRGTVPVNTGKLELFADFGEGQGRGLVRYLVR